MESCWGMYENSLNFHGTYLSETDLHKKKDGIYNSCIKTYHNIIIELEDYKFDLLLPPFITLHMYRMHYGNFAISFFQRDPNDPDAKMHCRGRDIPLNFFRLNEINLTQIKIFADSELIVNSSTVNYEFPSNYSGFTIGLITFFHNNNKLPSLEIPHEYLRKYQNIITYNKLKKFKNKTLTVKVFFEYKNSFKIKDSFETNLYPKIHKGWTWGI